MERESTAVEWLFLMMSNPNLDMTFQNKLLKRAKEIEKEQIIKAFEVSSLEAGYEYSARDWAEQYYKDVYEKGK